MLIKANNYSLSPRRVVAGTRGSYGIETLDFAFSPEWNGLTKRVTFYPVDSSPVSVLYEGEPIKIPAEVMATAGVAQFTLSGLRDGAALISVTGQLDVFDTNDPVNDPALQPTPSELEQVIALMTEAVETAQSVRDDADNGVFDGRDGIDGHNGADGRDGYEGRDGVDGVDGVSPTVSVAQIPGGYRITITDAAHPDGQNFNIRHGADGMSPLVSLSVIPGGHHISIDDEQHTMGQEFDILDGVSPSIAVSSITGGHRVTITDPAHPSGQSFDVLDGDNGNLLSGDGENSVVLNAAAGYENTASGDHAIALGEKIAVTGDGGFAAGSSSTDALDRISDGDTDEEIYEEWAGSDPEEDKFTLVKGENGSAFGTNGLVLKKNGQARGNGCVSDGNSAEAAGTGCKSLDKYAFSDGLESVAHGVASRAENYQTNAYDKASKSEGYKTEAGWNDIDRSAKPLYNPNSTYIAGTLVRGEDGTIYCCIKRAVKKPLSDDTYWRFERGQHSEGVQTYARNFAGHAEGYKTEVLAEYGHAEGDKGKVTGKHGHIEGSGGITSGSNAHTEGWHEEGVEAAKGGASHAEGDSTVAYLYASHVEGYHTESQTDIEGESDINVGQHVAGRYNVKANGARITGGGDDEHGKNIEVLDWQGNLQLAGNLTLGDGVGAATLTPALIRNMGNAEVVNLAENSSYHAGKISILPNYDQDSEWTDDDFYRARLDFQNGKIVIESLSSGNTWTTVKEVEHGFVVTDLSEGYDGSYHRPTVAWAFDGVCDYLPVVVDENDYDFWVNGEGEDAIPYKCVADGNYVLSMLV